MKNLRLSLEKSKPCILTIPEIPLEIEFNIASANIALIGDGLDLTNVILNIVETKLKLDKPYNGVVINSIKSEDMNRVSKFKFNEPAFALFIDDRGKRINVYVEPVYAKFSDKYINSFGIPHFNITTMSGVKFA